MTSHGAFVGDGVTPLSCHLSFSELNSIESVELVEYYFFFKILKIVHI